MFFALGEVASPENHATQNQTLTFASASRFLASFSGLFSSNTACCACKGQIKCQHQNNAIKSTCANIASDRVAQHKPIETDLFAYFPLLSRESLILCQLLVPVLRKRIEVKPRKPVNITNYQLSAWFPCHTRADETRTHTVQQTETKQRMTKKN